MRVRGGSWVWPALERCPDGSAEVEGTAHDSDAATNDGDHEQRPTQADYGRRARKPCLRVGAQSQGAGVAPAAQAESLVRSKQSIPHFSAYSVAGSVKVVVVTKTAISALCTE
jgi:hypothetical protein